MISKCKWVPYGPNAVVLQFNDLPSVQLSNHISSLVESIHPDANLPVKDLIPGFTSLTIEFEETSELNLTACAERILQIRTKMVPPEIRSNPKTHEIPVSYQGPDLQRVAAHAQMTVEEVIKIHSDAEYQVQLVGFCPGFPYLHGLPERIQIPRLEAPRPLVPQGSVAIGGPHTGIYTVQRAGGWNIIGSTSVKLFLADLAKGSQPESSILMSQGDLVRFVPISN